METNTPETQKAEATRMRNGFYIEVQRELGVAKLVPTDGLTARTWWGVWRCDDGALAKIR